MSYTREKYQLKDIKEKVQTLLIVPKMPFGLTVFQIVQVLMLAYIILKQNYSNEGQAHQESQPPKEI